MTILVALTMGLIVVLWNQSRPTPTLNDGLYTARWQHNSRYDTPSFADQIRSIDIVLSSAGLDQLQTIVVEARPVRNPFRILWEHLKYWMNTRLFPVNIWMDGSEWNIWATYYQHDKYVFLRQSNPWHNAVLAVDFSVEEIERLLFPFVVDNPPPDPSLPAEAEPPDSLGPGAVR